MASNEVTVTIKGQNQASPAIQEVKRDLGGLDNAASQLAGGLRGLVGVVGIAGIATLGAQVVRAASEFGDLGESIQRSEKYFVAFSGSATDAARNLEAVQRATEGALSKQESMNAAAKLLSMGLADNASELSTMSRMAVMLGGSTRTAAQAIDEFSLLLANQSILRLDTFGISGARVRERIDELMSSTKGMTREQAFMNAVMEEGSRKVKLLEDAGVRAGTSQDRLRSATEDLKAELAELTAQPYTVVVDMVIRGVKGVNEILQGTQALEMVFDTADAQKQIQGITERLEYLRDLMQRDAAGEHIYRFNAANAQKEIDDLEDKLLSLVDANSIAGGSAGVAAVRMVDAYTDAKNAVNDLADALDNIAYKSVTSGNAAWGTGGSGDFYKAMTDNKIAEDLRYAREVRQQRDQRIADEKRAGETIAKSYAKSYDAEFQKVSSRISGYLQQGMSAAKGLLDLSPETLFAPGSNGPFENLFRALDVAKLGGASPWAEVLGLTQEEAKRISEDFQRGIFSEDVIGLVDQGALIKEAQLAALAEKTQAAFANAIAQKAGVKTNLVASLFGFDSGTQGAASKAQENVSAAMSQVADTLGDTVKGKDFAGRIIGYGTTLWSYFEKGIVDQANGSAALVAAIDAMVANAISKRGGSVTGAARGAGVQ